MDPPQITETEQGQVTDEDKFRLLEILPFLKEEEAIKKQLLSKLTELYVDDGDLEFIEVEDLIPPLNHIKAKRLVAEWRKRRKPNSIGK